MKNFIVCLIISNALFSEKAKSQNYECVFCKDSVSIDSTIFISRNNYEGVIVNPYNFVSNFEGFYKYRYGKLIGMAQNKLIKVWQPDTINISRFENKFHSYFNVNIEPDMNEYLKTFSITQKSYIRQYLGVVNCNKDTVLITNLYYPQNKSKQEVYNIMRDMLFIDDPYESLITIVFDVKADSIMKVVYKKK